MPMDRSRYPTDWEEIALQVKTEANWTCQQCGKQCRRTGETLLDYVQRITEGNLRDTAELWNDIADHPQKYTLTVAHLDHTPENCDRSNLKALCAPCHCRLDLQAMALKKNLKRERAGQLKLF